MLDIKIPSNDAVVAVVDGRRMTHVYMLQRRLYIDRACSVFNFRLLPSNGLPLLQYERVDWSSLCKRLYSLASISPLHRRLKPVSSEISIQRYATRPVRVMHIYLDIQGGVLRSLPPTCRHSPAKKRHHIAIPSATTGDIRAASYQDTCLSSWTRLQPTSSPR